MKQKSKILKDSYELLKDEKLDVLSSKNIANIAQYISFEPGKGLTPKFIHINNFVLMNNLSTERIIETLILSSKNKCVNIRSFSTTTSKGNKFIYGKTINDISEILQIIEDNAKEGKHSIINENIDINDGGVSGVILGNNIEFSPEDTPRCVDKEGVCSLPRFLGLKLLETVYGFKPDIEFDQNLRIEFSLHPSRQGVRKSHTIIWEYEYYKDIIDNTKIVWPNRFSSFLGDKVFGLLISNSLGLPVPKTTVISRKVAPFTFGMNTGLKETWIRTCPVIKEPGKFFTGPKWVDPFVLMNEEEEKTNNDNFSVASIISQAEVPALYSGASFIRKDQKNDIIEGVQGNGDEFMIGTEEKGKLPSFVRQAVEKMNDTIRSFHNILGEVSIEWVFDGNIVWIVQMNQLKTKCVRDKNIIVFGSPEKYDKVFVKDGLDNLREKINLLKDKNIGIQLIGNVGITSHFGDVLRLSGIPSFITNQ